MSMSMDTFKKISACSHLSGTVHHLEFAFIKILTPLYSTVIELKLKTLIIKKLKNTPIRNTVTALFMQREQLMRVLSWSGRQSLFPLVLDGLGVGQSSSVVMGVVHILCYPPNT